MPQISSTRGLLLTAAAAAFAANLALAAAPARGQVDLSGTWHVLVHYKDEASSHPERERWDDRLWSFEPSGSRIRWREWPIVVFSDESGRFERRGTGQYARVLHYWEPTQSQIADIKSGLSVNNRGSKEKTLRRHGDAWRSAGGARAASAMTITYQENWTIENASELPVFIREEMLGSAVGGSMEGRSEYRTEEIRDGGDLLVGTYERDGTRRGTFRMMRAGEHKQLEAKSQRELQQQAWARQVMSSQEVREEIRSGFEKALGARGVSLEDDRLEELVDEWFRLYQSGLREDEIGERLIREVLREAGDSP